MADAAAGCPVLKELDVDALAKRLFDLGETTGLDSSKCKCVHLPVSLLSLVLRANTCQDVRDLGQAACARRSVGEHRCEEPSGAVQREQGAAQVQAQAAEACGRESCRPDPKSAANHGSNFTQRCSRSK